MSDTNDTLVQALHEESIKKLAKKKNAKKVFSFLSLDNLRKLDRVLSGILSLEISYSGKVEYENNQFVFEFNVQNGETIFIRISPTKLTTKTKVKEETEQTTTQVVEVKKPIVIIEEKPVISIDTAMLTKVVEKEQQDKFDKIAQIVSNIEENDQKEEKRAKRYKKMQDAIESMEEHAKTEENAGKVKTVMETLTKIEKTDKNDKMFEAMLKRLEKLDEV